MSHLDFTQGVYYPEGGIYRLIEVMTRLALKAGVTVKTNSPVRRITVEGSRATGIELSDGGSQTADIIISNADLHYTETTLLPLAAQSYPAASWKRKVAAPSALLMYLGVRGRVPQLAHHNLRFANDWKTGFDEIFGASPVWPENPSLYVSAPSRTDPTVAPLGDENLFVLVPIAASLRYTSAELERHAQATIELIEREFQIPELTKRIIYQKLFCVKDFEREFHAYRGTALGLAHTLRQTAAFRPDTKSRKLSNLYYVGAETNPGIGLPMCLISAELIVKRLKNDQTAGPLKTL